MPNPSTLFLRAHAAAATILLLSDRVSSFGVIDGIGFRGGARRCRSSGFVAGSDRRMAINMAGAANSDDASATIADVASKPCKRVMGLRELAGGGGLDDYDTFLLDMWGVMHDGSKPYEGVLETVEELKKAGKSLVILSNSSKRKEVSIKMLRKLGFDPDDFEQIITSGDVAHDMLSNNVGSLGCSNWDVLGDLAGDETNAKKVFLFGSGSLDEEYIASAGWNLSPIHEADLIVARGTFTINDGSGVVVSKTEDGEEKYFRVLEESLSIAASRKVPMLVTNPDKVRPDEGLPPMPGAIGDAYEATLAMENAEIVDARSLVKRIGKPFREVYDIALRGKEASRAIMIGDALETDITGGTNTGCSTLWVVEDGIHADAVVESGSFEDGARSVIESFNCKDGTYAYGRKVMPEYVTTHFRW